MKKFILLFVSLFVVAGCDLNVPKQSSFKSDTQTSESNQQRMTTAVPIPVVTKSLERKNVSARAQLFDDENKISYIYLTSFGKVMAFYTVKGKVSSLRSYMSPSEKLVTGGGDPCNNYRQPGDCYTVESPDIDGTYGENIAGIFFYTTENAYVETQMDYIVSDQPLLIRTPAELFREVK